MANIVNVTIESIYNSKPELHAFLVEEYGANEAAPLIPLERPIEDLNELKEYSDSVFGVASDYDAVFEVVIDGKEVFLAFEDELLIVFNEDFIVESFFRINV